MCVLLTNSQILAREACQQGCAAWDKLRQVTTGGRREECKGGNYRNSVHASQPIVGIKPISAVIVHVGLRFVCSFFEQNYFRKGGNLHIGSLGLIVWLSSMFCIGDECCFLALC